MSDELNARLRAIVGAANVLDGETDMAPFLSDWRGRYHGRARAVVRPRDTAEVAAVVAACAQAGVAMVPQGGNTGLCGGATPLADGAAVVISLARLDRVRALDPDNDTLTVEAGCTLAAVQEAAQAAGRLFPLSLASEGSCLIGGNLSTNAGGVQVLRYGNTRDLVLGLEVVLPDGRVWDGLRGLRKDNTGYDLKQLFIGAEGTLGVVTRILLRLTPKPASQETALVALNDFASVTALLNHAKRQLDGTLSAFEVMWNGFYSAVTTPPAPHQPPLPGHFPFYVLIEALGSDPQQDHPRFERAMSAALESGLISDAVVAKSEAERHRLWALRDDVAQLGRYYPLTGFDISLPLEAMEAYLSAVEQRLKADWEQTRLIIFGHLGDGNLHLAVSLRADSSEERQRVEEIVYSELASRNGSISAEHGIGLQKKAYLHHCRSADEVALMRRIKQALDPKGTLNPGKIFD